MRTTFVKFVSLAVLTAMISAPLARAAEEVSEVKKEDNGKIAYKVADVALVRPVGLGLTVIGGALFLVSWPITAASGDSNETYDFLVRKPSRYVFDRKEGRDDSLPKGTKVLKAPRNQ